MKYRIYFPKSKAWYSEPQEDEHDEMSALTFTLKELSEELNKLMKLGSYFSNFQIIEVPDNYILTQTESFDSDNPWELTKQINGWIQNEKPDMISLQYSSAGTEYQMHYSVLIHYKPRT